MKRKAQDAKELELAEPVCARAEEEEVRRAEQSEADQWARIKTERESQRVELARLKTEEELKRFADTEVEQEPKTQVDQQRQQLEQARLKAVEEINRRSHEIVAEKQARIKAQEEARQAALALDQALKEAQGKAQEFEAEQVARIKAEDERQQTKIALQQALKEAESMAQEVAREQQARIKLEHELQLTQIARSHAEEEAKRRAQELEAERQAKLAAQLERGRAKKALAKAEAEEQRRAKQAREQEARIRGDLQRQPDDKIRFQTESSTSDSTKFCPRCSRFFSADRTRCLYDATPLLDAKQLQALTVAKPPVMSSRVVLIIAMAFCVILILGIVAINRFLNVPTSAAPDAAQQMVDHEPTIVTGLSDKDAQLPSPEYPARAKSEGVSGKVTVAILVDKRGAVTSARALDGHPLLQATALAAAKKSKFSVQPNQRGSSSGTITYNFK